MSFFLSTRDIDATKPNIKKALKYKTTKGIDVKSPRAVDKDGVPIPPQPSRIAVSTHNIESIQAKNKKKLATRKAEKKKRKKAEALRVKATLKRIEQEKRS